MDFLMMDLLYAEGAQLRKEIDAVPAGHEKLRDAFLDLAFVSIAGVQNDVLVITTVIDQLRQTVRKTYAALAVAA